MQVPSSTLGAKRQRERVVTKLSVLLCPHSLLQGRLISASCDSSTLSCPSSVAAFAMRQVAQVNNLSSCIVVSGLASLMSVDVSSAFYIDPKRVTRCSAGMETH